MSEQACRRCNKLFVNGDVVRAQVISRFIALKSKLHYAIEKPEECDWMEHVNCQWPQEMPEE